MITALAGGVGAARMLRGLQSVVPGRQITAVVNTGDDVVMHGLHVSPDLDTVTYTLAGMINPDTGWGLRGETWSAMAELREYSGGRLSWFNLGDRDLGTHLYRTARLGEGAALHEVAAEIARRWSVEVSILPMTDDRVETRVVVDDTSPEGREIGFQEYFVGAGHDIAIKGLRLAGIERARPAPGTLEALAAADRVVICPSNPLVSIGPVLAVPGLAAAVEARRDDAVAVSPIVSGRALKGPADRMLAELGHESSVVGVARLWARYAARLVIDEADRDLAGDVARAGMEPVVAPAVMTGPAEAAALARVVLGEVSGAAR